MELNREQIIKALECCIKDDCDNCPNSFGNCYSNLAGYALALIKELIEENKRLIKENDSLKTQRTVLVVNLRDTRKKVAEVTEENENLHASCTELTQCCTKLETLYKIECKRVDTARADTVREMAERLKSRQVSYGNISFRVVHIDDIDQIEKEMLEETK